MKKMFNGAHYVNGPVGDWEMSKVTNMKKMFQGAAAFNQPVGDWDTSKVDMEVD